MARTSRPLNPADHAALAAVRASGRVGLGPDEIRDILGLTGIHAVELFAKRCRDRGHPVRAICTARTAHGRAYRYVVEGSVAAPYQGDGRPVTRLVSGKIGMGSTPGTPVSVAYVSCLDGARRPGQCVGDRA